MPIHIKIGIGFVAFAFSFFAFWLMAKPGRPVVDSDTCLVPTCKSQPDELGVCRKHYSSYVQKDAKALELLKYLYRMYYNQLTFAEKVRQFLKAVIHAVTFLSFKGYEHFPLENIFNYQMHRVVKLRQQNRVSDAMSLVTELVKDFDTPENYMLLNAKAFMREIEHDLTGKKIVDESCAKQIRDSCRVSLGPFIGLFFISLCLLIVLNIMAGELTVAGFLGNEFFLRARVPLLIGYMLLVPIYFGVSALRRLPHICNRLLKENLYKLQVDTSLGMDVFWRLCSSLRRKQHFDSGYAGILFAIVVLTIINAVGELSNAEFLSFLYRILEFALIIIFYKILMKLRLFMRTVSIAVDLPPKGINIDVTHADRIGGHAKLGEFLANAFLMGILMYILAFFVVPHLLFTNYSLSAPIKISYFVFMLVFLLPFTHTWRKSLIFLFHLTKQMREAKRNAVRRLTNLQHKSGITSDEVRELHILHDAIAEFHTFPLTVNTRFTTIAKIILMLIISYCLGKFIDYLLPLVKRLLFQSN